MERVVYEGVDLLIDEGRKEIVINPKGERFYFTGCDEQHRIFRNATVRFEEEKGQYAIDGEQTLYGEHKGVGRSYEKLLCLHPARLIRRHSFFGFVWYSVRGSLSRDVYSRYVCEHTTYRIFERSSIGTHTYGEI